MSRQGWQEVFVTSQVDGTALTASVTATSIIPAAARFTLPPNFFSEPGKAIRARASGRITTVATPGTLTFDIRLGPTSNIVVWNGGAMTLNATVQTNATWIFEVTLTCRAIGAGTSTTLIGSGTFSSRALVGSAAAGSGYGGTALLPDTAPAVGTGFDGTVATVADLFATWGTNNANSILCHQYVLESLN